MLYTVDNLKKIKPYFAVPQKHLQPPNYIAQYSTSKLLLNCFSNSNDRNFILVLYLNNMNLNTLTINFVIVFNNLELLANKVDIIKIDYMLNQG